MSIVLQSHGPNNLTLDVFTLASDPVQCAPLGSHDVKVCAPQKPERVKPGQSSQTEALLSEKQSNPKRPSEKQSKKQSNQASQTTIKHAQSNHGWLSCQRKGWPKGEQVAEGKV